MEPTSSAIGLSVILILYVSIGGLAATGSMFLSKTLFGPKGEQTFYALFLIAIAAFYLAFTAHFGADDAWQLEATAAAFFSVFGLLGVRFPVVLILGYVLHGLWDAVHEYNAYTGTSLLGDRPMTSVPMAYGFFCAAFDFIIAGYFYTRRAQWLAAWSGK